MLLHVISWFISADLLNQTRLMIRMHMCNAKKKQRLFTLFKSASRVSVLRPPKNDLRPQIVASWAMPRITFASVECLPRSSWHASLDDNRNKASLMTYIYMQIIHIEHMKRSAEENIVMERERATRHIQAMEGKSSHLV